MATEADSLGEADQLYQQCWTILRRMAEQRRAAGPSDTHWQKAAEEACACMDKLFELSARQAELLQAYREAFPEFSAPAEPPPPKRPRLTVVK